jgi:hypothetical protein
MIVLDLSPAPLSEKGQQRYTQALSESMPSSASVVVLHDELRRAAT